MPAYRQLTKLFVHFVHIKIFVPFITRKLWSVKMSDMYIEVSCKPRKIEVANGNYTVSIFLDDELVSVLPLCYNSYDEAIEAIKDKLKGV